MSKAKLLSDVKVLKTEDVEGSWKGKAEERAEAATRDAATKSSDRTTHGGTAARQYYHSGASRSNGRFSKRNTKVCLVVQNLVSRTQRCVAAWAI